MTGPTRTGQSASSAREQLTRSLDYASLLACDGSGAHALAHGMMPRQSEVSVPRHCSTWPAYAHSSFCGVHRSGAPATRTIARSPPDLNNQQPATLTPLGPTRSGTDQAEDRGQAEATALVKPSERSQRNHSQVGGNRLGNREARGGSEAPPYCWLGQSNSGCGSAKSCLTAPRVRTGSGKGRAEALGHAEPKDMLRQRDRHVSRETFPALHRPVDPGGLPCVRPAPADAHLKPTDQTRRAASELQG